MTIAEFIGRSNRKIVKQGVALSCLAFVCLSSGTFHLLAQTNQCTTERNKPAFKGPAFAWPQNAPVNVNVNSTQFSPADLACIQQVFDNYNNVANTSGANSSGVYFRVTYTSTVIANTVNGTAETAPTSAAAAGTYNYQVNRPTTLEGDNPDAFGQTGTGGTGDYRTSAVTNINSHVTDCEALKQTLAHEIGHTFGLGECPDCDARGSVMVGGAAVRNPDGSITRLYNDTSRGLTSPNPCDNQVVRQGATYNPATVNQPREDGEGGGGGGDGGSGGGGGDGGGGCTEYWWVEYSCTEEEGKLRREGSYAYPYRIVARRNHAKRVPEYSCVETGRWLAGCW